MMRLKRPGFRPRLLQALVLAAMAGGAALTVGCQDQLFSPTEPRSQYDRFDSVRDRRSPDKVEDEFGNMRPNLRGRLLTSE